MPGTDGRAGTAALVVDSHFVLAAFRADVALRLPAYARPVFLRLMKGDAETTGTFKYRKVDLATAGFDPAKTSDQMYVMDADVGGYTGIDAEEFAKVMSGRMRL